MAETRWLDYDSFFLHREGLARFDGVWATVSKKTDPTSYLNSAQQIGLLLGVHFLFNFRERSLLFCGIFYTSINHSAFNNQISTTAPWHCPNDQNPFKMHAFSRKAKCPFWISFHFLTSYLGSNMTLFTRFPSWC